MPRLIAIKELRYAGLTYLAGTPFEASDKDAKLLKLIGKAKDSVAVERPKHVDTVPKPAPADDALAAARAEYEAKVGKRPFMGWNVAQIRERIGTYNRRDMRAEE